MFYSRERDREERERKTNLLYACEMGFFVLYKDDYSNLLSCQQIKIHDVLKQLGVANILDYFI